MDQVDAVGAVDIAFGTDVTAHSRGTHGSSASRGRVLSEISKLCLQYGIQFVKVVLVEAKVGVDHESIA